MIDERIKFFRLYEKVSSRGNRYFVGRLAGARVVVMKDERAELSEGTEAVWDVMLSPAEDPAPRRAANTAGSALARPKRDVKTNKPASSQFIEDALPWTP
ncbi:MAG: hypothetical protein LWW93_12025 [Hyphomicrobiales bacterium]|nr:hypothetical protein [Hyphomicrobiales bacterium]